MPQVHLENSANLPIDAAKVPRAVHIALLSTGQFKLPQAIADAALAGLQGAHDWQALPLQVQLGAEVHPITLATYARSITAGQVAA